MLNMTLEHWEHVGILVFVIGVLVIPCLLTKPPHKEEEDV